MLSVSSGVYIAVLAATLRSCTGVMDVPLDGESANVDLRSFMQEVRSIKAATDLVGSFFVTSE